MILLFLMMFVILLSLFCVIVLCWFLNCRLKVSLLMMCWVCCWLRWKCCVNEVGFVVVGIVVWLGFVWVVGCVWVVVCVCLVDVCCWYCWVCVD